MFCGKNYDQMLHGNTYKCSQYSSKFEVYNSRFDHIVTLRKV
jgi:hypothetical protein